MPAHILNIATEVPEQIYEQSFLREKMKEYLGDKEAVKRIIHRIYTKSGIDKRHTVVNDFLANGHPRLFFNRDGTLSAPSTGTRNELYTENARKLFTGIGRRLLDQNPAVSKEDITHVITVSCTGFFAPEPAYEIVTQLGLPPSTERYHLGFMGCFAAFPALKMAQSFCESDPGATVMIVCLELCSIHFQDSQKTDNLISASVFADGGAGALVSAQANSKPGNASFSLEQFATNIARKSKEDMAWTIGDTGFDMVLSTYVPEIIENNLLDSVEPLINRFGTRRDNIDYWAIHPGGRAILDNAERSLELAPGQLEASRNVLANYGNMSSATILFVLKELLEQPEEQEKTLTLAMAFGPGLTIESGLFTKTTG